MKSGDKILVKQIRSEAGRSKRFRDTLKALGFHGIGSERTIVVNPAVFGMMKSVETVLKVVK